MKRLMLFLISVLVLIPSLALATSKWGACGAVSVATASSGGTDYEISANERECFYFTGTEDSVTFTVTAKSAQFCLNPDYASEGPANATVWFRYCTAGIKAGSTGSINTCMVTTDTAVDGTIGAPGSQHSCYRYGPGDYYIDNAATADGDEAVVSIQGE